MTSRPDPNDIAIRLRRLKTNGVPVGGLPEGLVYISDDALEDAASEIDKLRGLLAEVLDCIDEDDYWALTEMFPRIKEEVSNAH